MSRRTWREVLGPVACQAMFVVCVWVVRIPVRRAETNVPWFCDSAASRATSETTFSQQVASWPLVVWDSRVSTCCRGGFISFLGYTLFGSREQYNLHRTWRRSKLQPIPPSDQENTLYLSSTGPGTCPYHRNTDRPPKPKIKTTRKEEGTSKRR
jgi:hypothetical protein